MSGSFKKIAKSHQKTHRERPQPEHRAHLGHLERKKDYVQRAREHHRKRDKIIALKKKAADRNPNEFYFNMVNSEKVDGVHQAKNKDTVTVEQEMLMKREDLRYVIMKRTAELKKIERLKSELQLLDPDFINNKHTVFVDKEEEMDEAKERLEDAKKVTAQKIRSLTAEQQKEMDKKYSMLAKRYDRLKELTTIAEKLEMSMHLTKDKTSKKKLVKEETKNCAAVYRWCYQRKR